MELVKYVGDKLEFPIKIGIGALAARFVLGAVYTYIVAPIVAAL